MKLSKLGEYIEIIDERNTDGRVSAFMGLNKNKEFMQTVASTDDVDPHKYKIVRQGDFVFSGMQTGRDQCIRIGHSEDEESFLVSPAYTTFRAKDVIPEYFFMLFKSSEMDRLGWFISDSSIRSNLDWDRFCDIEVQIPNTIIQQKYVDVYQALVANQKAFENGLDDMKLTCDVYIENLRRMYPAKRIGEYIEQVNRKNSHGLITNVKGVSAGEGFIETKANMSEIDLVNYKIVYSGEFAFTPTRINIGSIALYSGEPCVVSPFYVVFRTISPAINPIYLLMWLKRDEFYRYTLFKSDGNIRQTFDFPSLCDVAIPIPDTKIQMAIADVFLAYIKRKEINEILKQQISDICPILIKGSIEEAQRG